MNIKSLYYKLRYRNLKDSSCIGVIYGSSNKNKKDFDKKIDNFAKKAEPCKKSNKEVLEYLNEKYGINEEALSQTEKESYKVNYILNKRPELLKTPEIINNKKMLSRKEMAELNENSVSRIKEARAYPFEKLGLELRGFYFQYFLSDSEKLLFHIVSDEKNNAFNIKVSAINREMTDAEHEIISEIIDDIIIFQGITKEDIEKRTPEFLSYAAAVLQLY